MPQEAIAGVRDQAFKLSAENVAAESERKKIPDNCLLCGSALELTLSSVTDNRLGTPGIYNIQRCVKCGFEQTTPRPSLGELKQLYERYYNFGGTNNDALYARMREWFLFSFLNNVWTWLDGDVAFQRRKGSGRLLDIGCNEGRGLKMFARNGFQAEGLELNETAAAIARRAGFNIQTCLLDDFDPECSYDVAVLSNVLEHSLSHHAMLSDVRRLLNDRGQLWISCPNSQSWLRNAFGRSWVNWHVPYHISHFCPDTLRKLLVDTGYELASLRQITPGLWVAQSMMVFLFARTGRKTLQLRNPFLTLLLMLLARFVFFPALWLGDRLGHGDCLLVVARKA